jgi:cell division protein FtsL
VSSESAGPSRKAKKERKKSLLWLTEAQAALSWGVLLTMAALVGAIYLVQTSGIATAGTQVQLLQSELGDQKQENIELERDIAEAQSLDRLQRDALKLGFTRSTPGDVEFLVVPDYPQVSELTDTSEPESLTEPAENLAEALWLAIRNSIGDLIQGESS